MLELTFLSSQLVSLPFSCLHSLEGGWICGRRGSGADAIAKPPPVTKHK